MIELLTLHPWLAVPFCIGVALATVLVFGAVIKVLEWIMGWYR